MKKIMSVMCSLIALLVLVSTCAFAENEAYSPIEGKIGITGEGTYIMTNLEDESDVVSITIQGEGEFVHTYAEPGEYKYQIKSAQQGEDAVYKVIFSVFLQEGKLSLVTTIQDVSTGLKPAHINYSRRFVSPPVQKVVNGMTYCTTEFKLRLKARGNCPMPEGSNLGEKIVTIAGPGTVDFGQIMFTEPGVYEYDVTEINTGAANFSYDENVYTVRYDVTQEKGILKIERTLYKNNARADNQESIVVTNTYNDPNNPNGNPNYPVGKTGDNSGFKTYVLLTLSAAVVIVLCVSMFYIAGAQRKKEEGE